MPWGTPWWRGNGADKVASILTMKLREAKREQCPSSQTRRIDGEQERSDLWYQRQLIDQGDKEQWFSVDSWPWLYDRKKCGFGWVVFGVSRLKRIELIIGREVLSETKFDYSLSKFRQKWQTRNRSVIGQIFFIQIVFFRREMTGESLNCLGKTPELKDKLTMLVMVGRSTGRYCFRREVGIGSRSQKVLDDCETSLQISS